MKKVKFFLGLKTQLLIFSLVLFVPIILVSSYFFHEHTKNILQQEMRNKLLMVALLSSEHFKKIDISIIKNSEDIKKKEYSFIKEQLVYLKNKVPNIRYISLISKKDNDIAFFIADSATEPQDLNKDGKILPINEGLVLLGQKNMEMKISMESGMEQGFKVPSISNTIYTDKFGSWIRAYAPIPNAYNSIISVDMEIDNSAEEYEKFMKMFEFVIMLSFIIIFVLLFIGTKVFLFPIKKLTEKVSSIRNKNFTQSIPFSWIYGEIGELVESVNNMSDDLKVIYDKEKENKGQIEEKQKLIEKTSNQIKSKNFELNSTIMTLNSINDIVEELIAIKDTQILMDTVLPSVTELIKAEKGFIAEYIPEEKKFSVISTLNMNTINKEAKLTFNGTSCIKKLFETKNFVNIHDAGKVLEEEYKNAIVFPLMIEKEIKGIIFTMNKVAKDDKTDNSFIESDETVVRTLNKLVAAVWESIHLFELATIDGLSKLYVRRYFEKNFEEEIRKSARNNTKLSLVMIDIDNLQKCNHNYGHFVGDQVIQQVSESIKSSIGELDLASRYGGEKFTILMSEQTSSDAYELAEKIRENIQNIEVLVPIGDNLKITVSCGVSSFPENGSTVEELIRNAEDALYKAKQEGRNKVLLALK